MKAVHFIGIGGIGMSALARYYKTQGYKISGSDAARSIITDGLVDDGIPVKIGHKGANLPRNAAFIVRSQAIKQDNAEFKAAHRQGILILTYPEAVGELSREYKTIAIAGAHGKSTTTALAGLTLIGAKLDPTVIVGVNLKEFGGRNFRRGFSEWLVLEADEFGRAFLHYSPFIAVVTNIDREHLDVYKNLANIKTAFLKFFSNVQPGGALILNRDDKPLHSLKSQAAAIAKKKNIRVVWYSAKGAALKKLKKIIKISGAHNLSNATAVYELDKLLNISEKKTLAAIGSYRGAWRRMEYRGKLSSTLVYDDYAHHPTEIKATLQAFKEKFPSKPLICVFQPHQAKRLQALFKEFTSAFEGADTLVLIPSYKVAGRDEAKTTFTAERLAAAIKKKYPRKNVSYLADPKNIKKILTGTAHQRPSVLIMMGAGDIVQYTDSLVK